MTDETQFIEVYEWKRGETRPGSDRKPRHDCIDTIAIPPEGQAPQRGDLVHLHQPGHQRADELGKVTFLVVERELLWMPTKAGDESPARWGKMWIHVRALDDYEQPASAQPG